MGRDIGGECRRGGGGEEIEVGYLAEAGDVYGEDEVGWRQGTLGLETLGEAFGGVEDLEFYASLVAIGIQQWLQQLRGAVRINVEGLRLGMAWGGDGGEDCHTSKNKRDETK